MPLSYKPRPPLGHHVSLYLNGRRRLGANNIICLPTCVKALGSQAADAADDVSANSIHSLITSSSHSCIASFTAAVHLSTPWHMNSASLKLSMSAILWLAVSIFSRMVAKLQVMRAVNASNLALAISVLTASASLVGSIVS